MLVTFLTQPCLFRVVLDCVFDRRKGALDGAATDPAFGVIAEI